LNTKDAKEQLVGAWIIELDELDAVTRVGEWTSVISFVSRPTDRFRFSYGDRVIRYPRQCVFGATTERDNWIPNLAGKRRWWPVRCTNIDRDALNNLANQLWAEALVRYGAGERWWLHEDALVEAATDEQEARTETDAWQERVLNYANGFPRITTTEILTGEIHMPIDKIDSGASRRIASILRKAGWIHKLQRMAVGNNRRKVPTWCFVKKDDEP
jgi:predicted P-loop ATPase